VGADLPADLLLALIALPLVLPSFPYRCRDFDFTFSPIGDDFDFFLVLSGDFAVRAHGRGFEMEV